MAEIKDLSTTDASNNGTAANAGFPENMAYSDVNNAARALEGMIARWYADTNSTLDTGGSSNAYTLTPNRTVAAYARGDTYTVEASFTNTGAATINVSSLGAKSIVKPSGSAVASGDIQSGGIYTLVYDGTNFQMAGVDDPTTLSITTLTVSGVTTLNGNTVIGSDDSDTVTINADVASNVIPSADNTYDLGASGSEWKDLYIDGIAYVDTLNADSVDIDGGSIDGTTIGASSAAAGTFTTISGTTITASTSLKTPLIEYTDGDDAITIADGGGVTIADLTATTADINGGTFDGIVGGTTPAAGSFTTITASGDITAIGLKAIESVNGDPVLGHFYNENSGAAAESTVYITNSSTVSDGLFLQAYGASATTAGGFVQDSATLGSGSGASGGLSIMTRAAADMRFYTNGHTNERMRIDSSGNVGIGTASPTSYYSNTLHLYGSASAAIKISNSDTGSGNGDGVDLALDDSEEFRIIQRENAAMSFFTNATQAMTIDSSQNVGIGTASPSSELHVKDASAGSRIIVEASASGQEADIQMKTADDGQGWVLFNNGSANQGAVKYNHASDYMSFRTNGTDDQMRIDSAGAAYFMTTVDMGGDINVAGGSGIAIGNSATASDYRRIYTSGSSTYFWNGSNQGELNSLGAWVNASDVSLKKDIVDISYGLETVKKLKPRKYKMKSNDEEQIGFIAQEVETEVPEVVSMGETPDGEETRGISYGQMVAVLTKAIQEQQALIETLQSKVKALEEA